LQAEMM